VAMPGLAGEFEDFRRGSACQSARPKVSRLVPDHVLERLNLPKLSAECNFDVLAHKLNTESRQWSNKRYVMWSCSGGCGGISNRMNGIFEAFLHAMAIGYDLKINWHTPSHLHPDILHPSNRIDWTGGENLQNSNQLRLKFIDKGRKPYDLCKWRKHSIVRIQSNGKRIPVSDPNCEYGSPTVREIILNQSTIADVRRGCMWWFLFRLGAKLEDYISREMSRLSSWRKAKGLENAISIAMHVRVGDSHMRAGKGRETDDLDARMKQMKYCVQNLMQNLNVSSFVVLASDSSALRETIAKWPSVDVFISSSTPFHVDRTRLSSQASRSEGSISAFGDILLLSFQDFLVLSGPSGYGRLAQSIGMYNQERVVQCVGPVPSGKGTRGVKKMSVDADLVFWS
jgi:hypothetical protein